MDCNPGPARSRPLELNKVLRELARGGLSRQQPCEVLQENQVGVNASLDALAYQVLVLHGVEEERDCG